MGNKRKGVLNNIFSKIKWHIVSFLLNQINDSEKNIKKGELSFKKYIFVKNGAKTTFSRNKSGGPKREQIIPEYTCRETPQDRSTLRQSYNLHETIFFTSF